MKVRHDLLHPRAADKPVRISGRDPGDEPHAGLVCRFPVVRGIANEEGFGWCGAGLVEDLPDTFSLRHRRTIDPGEVFCEIPAAGDLVHLGLRGCRDDIERECA